MSTLRVGFSSPTPRPQINFPFEDDRVKQPPLTGPSHNPTPYQPSTQKMHIRPVGSTEKLVVPFAPQEVTYSGYNVNWQEVARDGMRTPLLLPSGQSLPKMTFTAFFGGREWNQPWAPVLRALIKIARSKRPISVVWSSFESGMWRITNLTITSQRRHPRTNEITQATVQFEFTRASDAKKNVGAASGGKKNNNHHGSGPQAEEIGSVGPGGKFRPKKYKVKKGDTLQSIGMKFYKDHSAWRKIAKANKINNPKKKLKPGTVLVLP